MKHETRTDELTYDGRVRAIASTGWWCTSCDAATFQHRELDKVARAYVKLRAECEQALRAEAITKIYTQLRLCRGEARTLRAARPSGTQRS